MTASFGISCNSQSLQIHGACAKPYRRKTLLENPEKSANIESGLEQVVAKRCSCCFFFFGGEGIYIDLRLDSRQGIRLNGFRKVFCIFIQHCLCPLILGPVSCVFQQRQGPCRCWPWRHNAVDGAHREASPRAFPRKVRTLLCCRPKKQLAFMVRKDLSFFTSKSGCQPSGSFFENVTVFILSSK